MANVVITNDYLITWTITDAITGMPVTDATVTAQLYDSSGAAHGSQISLSHVSSGLYRGTLPDTASPSMVAIREYELVCTATSGSGVVANRKIKINTQPL